MQENICLMLREPQKKNLSCDLSSLEEYLGGCDLFCGIVGTFRGGRGGGGDMLGPAADLPTSDTSPGGSGTCSRRVNPSS